MKKFNQLALSVTLLALGIHTGLMAQTSKPVKAVNATLETRPHFDDRQDHFTDVDDPAIWIHPGDKSRSVVITALKQGGLDVYDLEGQLLQYIAAATPPPCEDKQTKCGNKGGRLNNVDLIYNVKLGNRHVDIAVASDRGLDKLAIYAINTDKQGKITLEDVTSADAPLIFSHNQAEINQGLTAYGLATVQTDKNMAFVSQNGTTEIAQLELFEDDQGKINYRNMARLNFPSTFSLPDGTFWTPCSDDDGELPHFEGMVADPANDALYLAQEDVGIWRTSLAKPNDLTQWSLFAKVKKYGVPYSRTWNAAEEEYSCKLDFSQDPGYGSDSLQADAEGLTLYDGGNGKGYLLASSQGNNTVAVYQREGDNRFIDSFTVADGEVDAVNETDGMMVVNVNLGGKFNQGLLVMQDGQNMPAKGQEFGQRESTNFKYVAWGDIAKKLKLPVNTEDMTRK